MSNIMSMVKLRNKVSRNGFDLSRKNLFTAKVGEALPVACIECLPGDSFDIDMAWFTRTQPVNTAAYTRIREYYDWYFVPTNLLWNKFNTFVTQMTDNNQKADGINGNVQLTAEHPYFTTSQIFNYLRSTIWGSKSNMFGYNRGVLTCKLLEYLGYGDFYAVAKNNTNSSPFVNAKLNPFPLLAYQKIYQDYIRDSQWEKAYAPACNIDYISGADGTLNIPVSEIDLYYENMFDLRYFNWNKDYFMGLLPSSQYGGISLFDPTMESTFTRADGTTPKVGDALSVDYVNELKQFTIRAGSVASPLKMISLDKFNILAVRLAESKQKWAEITQSQQQDYKSQVSAHWNVDVSDAYSDRCKYIGGVNGSLDIDAVVNQNLADDNAADIAGRGQGGSRGQIKFDTKVHGYLMCIYHAAPLLDYAISGINRTNLKTNVFDYAIPEFDATGMVSVPAIEMLNNRFVGDNTGSADLTGILLGYAPRYVDYKTSIDRVHGAFVNGGLDAWTAPVSNSYIHEYLGHLGETIATGAFNYQFFKIPPSVMNTIFAVGATTDVSSDQILVNASFDIKAVRNLDRNGLPY